MFDPNKTIAQGYFYGYCLHMPELPEVETVCRGLETAVTNDTITVVSLFRHNLRFPFPDNMEERLEGRKIVQVSRRAKYILIRFDDNQVLIGHLGMSGSFRIESQPVGEVAKHEHMIWETNSGTVIRYHDPRRFGFMLLTTAKELDDHPRIRELGPEPLGNAFSGPIFAEALKNRKSPIKAALLDQKVVAGVGNIYACEALYRSGISPTRLANTIKGKKAEKLAEAIRAVLTSAIESGGSTLRDFTQTSGELGYFQHRFLVYDKEGEDCANEDCDKKIKRIVQSGRSTFYCASCQR